MIEQGRGEDSVDNTPCALPPKGSPYCVQL